MYSNWTHYLPLVTAVLVSLIVAYVLLLVSSRLLQWRRLIKRGTVCYELTPPAHTARTPQATQEFINIIHGFKAARSFKDKLMMRSVVLSLQNLSTREHGIRYMTYVDKHLAASFFQAITAYLPEVKAKQILVELSSENMQVIEFKQQGHYAFPLAISSSLQDHDPIGYLTNAMANLAQDDHMSFQITVEPVRLRDASIIAHKILGNEDLLAHLHGRKLALVSGFFNLMNKTLFAATDAVGTIHHGSTNSSYRS